MSRRTVGNPTFTAMLFGLAGGLVGAIVMGAVAYAIPAPNTGGNPFFIVAAKLIGFGTPAWAFGWLLHVITGMGIGAIFGVVVSRVPSLRTRKVGRGIMVGILAGIVAWVILFVPMMVWLMPKLVSVGSFGGGFLVNVIFGIIMAVMFVVGQSFYFVEPQTKAVTCGTCGAALPSRDELSAHYSEKHLKVEEQVQRVG